MHGPAHGEAKLRYHAGSFDVIRPGAFVTCATTGEKIPLDELRYWNPDVQEPYSSAEIALHRHQELRAGDRD